MNKLEEVLSKKKYLLNGKGVNSEIIEQSEKLLALVFAEDYKTYLQMYGVIVYDGHEITGITSSSRINVVNVTQENKEIVAVPKDWYVIEEMNIDNIVIWQSSEGSIYATAPNNQFTRVCNSFLEYIQN